MNIQSLKTIVANLPDEVTPEQFALVEADVEEVLAEQRRADEAELAETEQRAAKLREKLGVKVAAPPPVRPPPTRPAGETDFDNGLTYGDDEQSSQSFRDELADLRNRGVMKRRQRLEH